MKPCPELYDHADGLCDCAGFWPERYTIEARRIIAGAARSEDPAIRAQVRGAIAAAATCRAVRLDHDYDDCLACTTARVVEALNRNGGLPVGEDRS